MDGPASFTLLPLSSIMARTLPYALPQAIGSPTVRVPFCTKTVATAPLPLSSCASMITPRALRFGFAFNSLTSAVNNNISNNWSIPSWV